MTADPSVPAVGPVATISAARRRQPMYSSGYALALSTVVASAIGFFFWIVAARLYSQEVVGENSALLYSIMFVAGLAQLNLVNVLLRFVPVAGRRTRGFVITCYLVGGGLATVVGLGFAVGTRWWSPELAGVLDGWWSRVAFALACGVWAIFMMQDGVLAGVRRANAVLVENFAFSVLKLILVIVFAGYLSTSGITISWMAATAITVVLTNVYLFTRVLRVPTAAAHLAEPLRLPTIARFIGGDYLGTLCWLACTTLLPVLVFAAQGSAATAVFSMAWTIAFALYLVPSAMGQSLVAYTSTGEATIEDARRGVTGRALLLLTPVVGLLLLAAPLVLGTLGPSYAEQGTLTLQLAALSALPNIINSTAVSAARARRRVSVVVAVQGSISTLVIVLSLTLMSTMGIAGVGLALLVAQTIVASMVLVSRAGWFPRPIRRSVAGAERQLDLTTVADATRMPGDGVGQSR